VLDLTLLLVVAAVAVQLLPLPFNLRLLISPQLDVDRQVLLLVPDAASGRPLSLDPPATATALALMAAVAAIYWSCRHLCGRGHLRWMVQLVAIVGLLGVVAAIGQRAVDPTRIYGLWLPQDDGARPFGPFVNRNHFATWLLMGASLMAGAVVSGLHAVNRRTPGARSVLSNVVARPGSRLGVSVLALAAMMLALVGSLSRAAFAAAAAGVLVWCVLASGRASLRAMAVGVGAITLFAAVAMWTAPEPLLGRVQETIALGAAGRAEIWRDAAGVARAYVVTGSGMGSFERAMLVHQTGSRTTRTNQAHNQYLHLLAEGGLLVTVPVVCCVLAFLWTAARRLATDDSPTAWLRIGSIAGLAAVAVQGVWETGLRMPANGVLLAVVAAVATHRAAARR
jgi:O-antigen ligase